MMRRDLLKRLIDWCEDGEVRGCAIEQLHQVVVVIDKLGELGGVLAAGDELVDGLIWLPVVRMAWAMRRMMGRMMRMVPNSGFVDLLGEVVGGIQPALRVESFKWRRRQALHLVEDILGCGNGFVQSIFAKDNALVITLFDVGKDVAFAGNLVEEGLWSFDGLSCYLLNQHLVRDNISCGQNHERKDINELHDNDI